MSATRVFIGVDGGGTKTRAAVVDSSGNVLSEGVAGSSNCNSVGVDNAKKELFHAIQSALQSTSNVTVAGICLGMAGVDREEDKKRVTEWMVELLGESVPRSISNDGVVALASGTNGELHGVVVISGTGTIALGFHKDLGDQAIRAAGWGPLLGDIGSGYAIGQDCLTAVCRAADGRGEQTALMDAVLNHLQLSKPMDIIPWTYKDMSWDRIASLAPIVYTTAKSGDKIANQILDKATTGLFESISAVVKSLGFKNTDEIPIVLAGGNLTHEGSVLAERLKAKLLEAFPAARILLPSVAPHVGAALLAMKKFSQNL